MELTAHNLIKWFQLNYPSLVRSMKNCNHHYSETELNKYHLESDVFTHTMMVLLQASQESLNPYFTQHLLVAALLHDIGKPITRSVDQEKHKVHFFGHDPMSAFLAIPIIDRIIKEFDNVLNKQLILEAISIHTEVFKLTEKQLTERLIGNPHLALLLSRLSKCDHNGRFYESGDRITTDMYVQDKPSTIKGKYVVVLVGLPCSGKSTLVNNLLKEHPDSYVVLSRDEIVSQLGLDLGARDYNEAFSKIDQKEVDRIFESRKKGYIRQGLNVIIDMTNMSRKSRNRHLRGFPKEYQRCAYVVMTSLDNIMERNYNRDGKVVPEHVFENMIKSFYPPLLDEFDNVTWEFNK